MFDAKEKKFDVRIGFEPLFRQFVHVGRLLSDGTRAAQNYVWIAQWFSDNYFYFYSRPFDLKFHQRLKHAIAKTLYPLLDNAWYASSGAPYTKSYSDLCVLLDIKPHAQLSRVRHQLDASNEELVREHFVVKYDYPLKPNGEWSGNVRWWPGEKWLHDQEQKQYKRSVATSDPNPPLPPSTPTLQSDSEHSPQQILPLSLTRKASDADPAEVRVRTFYEQLGQRRPSREQIRAGAAILLNLVEDQGYAWEELDFTLRWMIGVSREGSLTQSVQVRPRRTDSGLVAREAPGRESQPVKPSDTPLGRERAQRSRLQRAVNAAVASLHATPVAEPVYNVRRQQGPSERSLPRRSSPAGSQRRQGAKGERATGEVRGVRRRKRAAEAWPITVSGQWLGWHPEGGSGGSTADPRAANRAGREGPEPGSNRLDKERQG